MRICTFRNELFMLIIVFEVLFFFLLKNIAKYMFDKYICIVLKYKILYMILEFIQNKWVVYTTSNFAVNKNYL